MTFMPLSVGPPTRREFIATSSLAVAGLSLGLPRSANATPSAIPIGSRQPVSTFFPDLVDPAILRALAQSGVDTARQAGASYADIRVSNLRWLHMVQYSAIPVPFSYMNFEYAYGIRVLVDGAWAFAFGVDPSTDGIARAARTAVNTARGLAKIAPPQPSMAPAPAVQGEWTTPVQIDPFSVSPEEHAKLLGAYLEAAKRVRDGDLPLVSFKWEAETRVFASTEGSLITQRLARAVPEVNVQVQKLNQKAVLPVAGFEARSAGFEIALGPELQERIKETTEEAARLASYTVGEAELGRYEAVIDGVAMGALLGGTLSRALEMGRVLGHETDGAGTSILSSVNDVLGKQLFSSHLNVTANRTLPNYGAAKWDDEGVATESFPVIEQGRIVDYFTSRVTAPVLSEWYAKRGVPLKSHGSAVSWTPMMPPTGCATHLTIESSPKGKTLDALVKEISNGLLLRGVNREVSENGIQSDQQLGGGLLLPMMMYEVKQGRITRRLKGGGMLFSTKQFWNSITAVGDSSTVGHCVYEDMQTDTRTTVPIEAPAAHLRQIDVTQTGIPL